MRYLLGLEICSFGVVGLSYGIWVVPSRNGPDYGECLVDLPLEADYSRGCSRTPPPGFSAAVVAAAEEFGGDPRLLATTVYVESGCDPKALGSQGDVGLTQIVPRFWAKELHEHGISNLWSPEQNLRAGAYVLAVAASTTASTWDSVRRYNGSGKRASQYAERHHKLYMDIWGEPYPDWSPN